MGYGLAMFIQIYLRELVQAKHQCEDRPNLRGSNVTYVHTGGCIQPAWLLEPYASQGPRPSPKEYHLCLWCSSLVKSCLMERARSNQRQAWNALQGLESVALAVNRFPTMFEFWVRQWLITSKQSWWQRDSHGPWHMIQIHIDDPTHTTILLLPNCTPLKHVLVRLCFFCFARVRGRHSTTCSGWF